MPKMQLDQRQPAKANAKTMAQRKKAKMLKEKAKLEELRKQFPKLFSPEKVKSIEQRNKQLVQPSLKKAVCDKTPPPPPRAPIVAKNRVDVVRSEDAENMPASILNRKPFSSPMSNTPNKKDATPSSSSSSTSSSSRVLQVLASPSMRRDTSSRVSVLPGCSCNKRQSNATARESLLSIDDVENQQCDICVQLGPDANLRKDMVHALRNFIHKPTPAPTVLEKENDIVVEEVKEVVVEIVDHVVSHAVIEEVKSPSNNLLADINMEQPLSELSDCINDETAPFAEEIVDSEVDQSECGDPSMLESETEAVPRGCFNQMLRSSLIDGRVRGRVVGRKVMTNHVEYICKIQVLKEGHNFEHIKDDDYMQDVMSPSKNMTAGNESPYAIQMCILRRYSDFEQLQEKLILESKKAQVDIVNIQKYFPGKQLFGSFGKRWADPTFVQTRQDSLSKWMTESAFPSLNSVASAPRLMKLQDASINAIHRFISM